MSINVASVDFLSNEEYEGFEYVGIFDWYVLDPRHPLFRMNGLICIEDDRFDCTSL